MNVRRWKSWRRVMVVASGRHYLSGESETLMHHHHRHLDIAGLVSERTCSAFHAHRCAHLSWACGICGYVWPFVHELGLLERGHCYVGALCRPMSTAHSMCRKRKGRQMIACAHKPGLGSAKGRSCKLEVLTGCARSAKYA